MPEDGKTSSLAPMLRSKGKMAWGKKRLEVAEATEAQKQKIVLKKIYIRSCLDSLSSKSV